MANIDWPANPNIGDIHTQNGNSWQWNGYAWDGVPVNTIPTPVVPEWERPNDWIAIPAIAPGEEVFYGLIAVYDVVDGNRVAFAFTGNYTVDWGDASPLENVLSGVKAEHLYDFANVANPTSEGWRQALIKVIPTGAANITSVDLQQQVGVIANSKTSQFMDIVMSVPNVTGAGTNLVIGNGAPVSHRVVERIDISDSY